MNKLWFTFGSVFITFLFSSCTARPTEPLSKAAAQGDLAEVNRYLSAGASSSDRELALMWAARFGQPAAIDLLIKSGADPNTRLGVNDWPILMHAIHKNQPHAVSALLNSGADVNVTGRNGETPLMMAAGYGYTDIVRILLDHHADPRVSMSNGENVLDFATSGVTDIDRFTWGKCQSETVRLLRERAPDLQPRNSAKLKNCS